MGGASCVFGSNPCTSFLISDKTGCFHQLNRPGRRRGPPDLLQRFPGRQLVPSCLLGLGRGYGTGHNGWFRAGRFAPAGRMLVFNDDNVYGYRTCPSQKFRPCLFTRLYVQLLDHDKPSQMWALSRKRPQETVILS